MRESYGFASIEIGIGYNWGNTSPSSWVVKASKAKVLVGPSTAENKFDPLERDKCWWRCKIM
jgi:hypothetical protein